MKNLFINLIKVYQSAISPLLGANCLYYPTCSQYAIETLEDQTLIKATPKIFLRVLSCNPINAYLKRRNA